MNDELIDEYILRHIDAEPERLHRLWRATQLHLLYPRMASGHLQGRMLVMLTRMIQPRRILELGTFSGYSALCLAEGMPDDAVLHTIEVNDEQEGFTRPWLEASPWADRIHLHIGNALDIVPTLGEPFDLIYIDADKRHYADFYRLVKPHLNSGGYILADNTLWDGHVVEPEHQHDAQTQGIMAFNDLVAQDKEVEKVILPMRDGLTIIRKK
ncbi:MAG: O-methyltransferase [Bacteroidaceae bacterium]|nr:O-methyltransferase [Bacteroidaceae bacterium]